MAASLPVPQARVTAHHAHGQTEVSSTPIYLRQTPVAWGIPKDEILYSKFLTILMKNGNIMPWDGFIDTESTYLPDARNQIHNAFIEQSSLPYLMMLDSDVIFPPFIVESLMEHKLPVVGGWYRNKHPKMEPHPIVYDFVSESESGLNWRHRKEAGSGVERVDGMGAGNWLMSREVAEKLGKSPYSMHKGTEDLVLCKKMMDLGIPLHVDWNIPCGHLGVRWV